MSRGYIKKKKSINLETKGNSSKSKNEDSKIFGFTMEQLRLKCIMLTKVGVWI